jgi:hypothetical protein
MWQEAFLAQFEVFQHIPGGIDGSRVKPQSEYPVCGTSQITWQECYSTATSVAPCD